MKKLLFTGLLSMSLAFAHGVPDMDIKKESHGMGMHHMYMGMPMMFMKDPEIRKLVKDHMKECRRELKKKLMKHPKVIKHMLKTLLMNKEELQKVLEENPDLRDELKTLLGG